MKPNTRKAGAIITLLCASLFNLAQAPSLGTAANFVLFTSNGAVGNTGITRLTGQVGSNSGSSTGFGNVNGTMHNNNGATGAAATDLLTAYGQLNSAVATIFPAVLLGNGQILNAGIYSISGNSTLSQTLTLDGQNNANAVFIFKIQGTFSSASNSRVILANGAQACNVFWKVEGLISLASGTTMKGTLVANNAAIAINSGVNLEGRALSTTGAISTDGATASTPAGCGAPVPTGPATASLGTSACYALFTANGPASNSGNTFANGDVGTNVGLTTGFNALNVIGAIHPIPDGHTAAAATDLLNAYSQMNTQMHDIELLYPAQFGNSLVLTPHTYLLNVAATFVDTLFLDALNNSASVFLIMVNGALSTSTYAKVALMNGALAENVYWKVEGAVDIDDYSEFVGTIVANNGAIDLGTGVTLNGRALTTDGALSVANVTVTMPVGCTAQPAAPMIISQPAGATVCAGEPVTFSVTATGSGLTYLWKNGSSPIANGGNFSGATTSALTISASGAADVSSSYFAVVSNVTASVSSSFASLQHKVCEMTALTDQHNREDFIIYPNPGTGVVFVQNKDQEPAQVRLFDVNGRCVAEVMVNGDSVTMAFNGMPGIYAYIISRHNATFRSGKIVIQ